MIVIFHRIVVKTSRNHLQNIKTRFRHFFKNMDSDMLQPPKSIRGITELDKSLFEKRIQVPALVLENDDKLPIIPHLKNKLLKMCNLKPIFTDEARKLILLHPLGVTKYEDLPVSDLEQHGIKESNFVKDYELTLTYQNWRADELLKFILPEDQEGLSSFSRIGHIIHLNLKEHLLPFKKVIAQILHDKMTGIRTIVNKSQTIDNVYRNFSMELLYGDEDYLATTKENGVTFEFDFSKVYWNPRLGGEHERIVKMLKSGDVLYDIFAGVGPFAIPAAKNGVEVYANDLNPDSHKWLQSNAIKNKVSKKVKTFNKDGRDFILEDVRKDFLERLKNPSFIGTMHFVMNLPALAVEFLDVYRGFLSSETPFPLNKLHIVHVYCFAKGVESKDQIALDLVTKNLGMTLPKNALVQTNFVRNVAPNKDMMRVDFCLTPEILFFKQEESIEPPLKKSKLISEGEVKQEENGKTFCKEGETTGSKVESSSETQKGDASL